MHDPATAEIEMPITYNVRISDIGVRLEFVAPFPVDLGRFQEEFVCDLTEVDELVGVEILFFSYMQREYEIRVLDAIRAVQSPLSHKGLVSYDPRHQALYLKVVDRSVTVHQERYIGEVLLDERNRMVGLQYSWKPFAKAS